MSNFLTSNFDSKIEQILQQMKALNQQIETLKTQRNQDVEQKRNNLNRAIKQINNILSSKKISVSCSFLEDDNIVVFMENGNIIDGITRDQNGTLIPAPIEKKQFSSSFTHIEFSRELENIYKLLKI